MAIIQHFIQHTKCISTKGFALFIAVVFMSVMLTFGIVLSSLGYKQQNIAVSATESQDAFYAADAAIECALYADQRLNLFAFDPGWSPSSPPSSVPAMSCGGATATASILVLGSTAWNLRERVVLNGGASCADVVISKPEAGSLTESTYIFSVGYNAPCAIVDSPGAYRLVARGLHTNYR